MLARGVKSGISHDKFGFDEAGVLPFGMLGDIAD